MKDRYKGNMNCPEHSCHCKEIGNGIHVKVNILSANEVQMASLFFVLCFYTYGYRNGVRLRKDQLVVRNGEYYALLNEKNFADGWLACDVEILEHCDGWPHNLRPVTVKCNTNLVIGGHPDDYQIPCDYEYHNGEGFVNGYNITFEKVDRLPDDGDAELKEQLDLHIGDKTVHITPEERDKWNQCTGGTSVLNYRLYSEKSYTIFDQGASVVVVKENVPEIQV